MSVPFGRTRLEAVTEPEPADWAPSTTLSEVAGRSVRPYNFRAALWRWHFYAGLAVAPILLILSITGALLVFAQEFDQWYYRDLLFVEPYEGERASLDTMRDRVEEGLAPLGRVEISDVILFDEQDRSVEFFATIDESYYVFAFANPGTGDYIGHFVFEQSPMRQIEQLHRRLLVPRDRGLDEQGGSTRGTLVELATSWAVLLTLTGAYLWWPRKWSTIWGVWLPRVRGRSYRVWRDWHSVPALYLSVLIALVAITGLVFSTWWGAGFRKIQEAGATADPAALYQRTEPRDPSLPVLPLEEIYRVAAAVPMPHSNGIALREVTPGGRYMIAVGYDRDTFNPVTGHYLLVDVHTGQVVEEQQWSDYDALTKARSLAYSVHVGSIFGLPTKLLALAVCLVLILATISGVVMWWKRRPSGGSGFPRRLDQSRMPWWFAITVLVVAALFPVAGISFFAALVLDRLYVYVRDRRNPRLA